MGCKGGSQSERRSLLGANASVQETCEHDIRQRNEIPFVRERVLREGSEDQAENPRNIRTGEEYGLVIESLDDSFFNNLTSLIIHSCVTLASLLLELIIN